MKRKQMLIAILGALGSLFTVLVAILINFATSTIPSIVQPYLPFAWPLVGAVSLAGVIVAIALSRLQAVDEGPAPTPRGNYRQRMLAKVRAIWINGVLEKSLQGTALIALGLQEQPEAVENSLRLVFQQTQQPAQSLPPGTSITQVYGNVVGELLILGEPGAGKTTLLLELARDLLEQAEHDEQHPIPAVFNLSSWAIKPQPLAEWLIGELHAKYRVPRKICQSWVESNQILPLLDGLDEVAEKARAACVDAINNYLQEHGQPAVVCSRSTEYNDLLETKHRLQLRSAIVIQPLTTQQIDDYLSSAGQQLEAVREVLYEDRELRELATTPFMLSILAVAYYGKSVADLTTGPLQMRREDIIATYVKRVLGRRGGTTRYTFEQTRHWLTWLAQQLAQRSLTEFYIQDMLPDWLPSSRSRWVYLAVTGLLYGLITGLVVGFGFGLLYGLVIGLLIGMIIMWFSARMYRFIKTNPEEFGRQFHKMVAWSSQGKRRSFDEGLQLYSGMSGEGIVTQSGLSNPTQTPIGWVIGWLSGLLTGLGYGLIVGPVVGLVTEPVFGQLGGLVVGLVVGLVAWVGMGIFYGKGFVEMEARGLVTHNWIWLVVIIGQGLFGGLAYGLFSGIFAWLISRMVSGLMIGEPTYVSVGMFILLFFGIGYLLLFGMLFFLLRVVLQLLLWFTGCIPLNYVRYLDYATEHTLLRKVGSGYIFIHRLVLDYFATLESTPHPNERGYKHSMDR